MKTICLHLPLIALTTQSAICEPSKPLGAKVSKLWDFPVGYWAENLAVRENGYILTTINTHPEVYQVDPDGKEPAVLVATIPRKLGLTGIAETVTDKFYVIGHNSTINPPAFGLHTFSVYKLDLTEFDGKTPIEPSLVANFRKGGFLDGMITLNAEKGLLLLADSTMGAVWRLNVKTGEKKKIISDPLMERKTFLGINGIKIAGNYLYWTNTDKQILARAPITPSGAAIRPGKVVAHAPKPDDLLLGDTCGKIDGKQGFIAGDDNIGRIVGSTVTTFSARKLLAGSTAVVFAPAAYESGCRDLYVSTSGGEEQYFSGNVTVPGRIVKVHCE